MNNKPMFNAYPDSLGGTLGDIAELLGRDEFKGIFGSFYILPSLYHSDLDRGFSVIDYDLNEELASKADLEALRDLGIGLKLDFILNHASAQSPQFRDLVAKGEQSEYKDFFINWNKFWEGHGEMTPEGYIQPDEEDLKKMFFRKPGLPLLMVQFPDGSKVPYWNTFYQEVDYPNYKGQMDLNIKSPKVWDFYRDVLRKLDDYGAEIVRLDAFAYAPKEPGERNFLNEPGTWDFLADVAREAQPHGLTLLPEIHAAYEDGIYKKLAEQGYATYDFFLPGLILDAIENHRSEYLARWAREIIDDHLQVVNMLGCHDGIPLLDLKGLLPDRDIEKLIDLLVSRGGLVKNLHGQKNMYYQVNATYFSALAASDRKMLMARAIQLFMPGKPQIWYLDLFAGENDLEAVRRAGESGHKEINRTNLTKADIEAALRRPVVQKQLEMIRFRTESPAFNEQSVISVENTDHTIRFVWEYQGSKAQLDVDFEKEEYEITAYDSPYLG
ncbi:MAG: sucrose phosphorylase [Clostridia bacterium]|nr:sucrose phosphorylase [Clostridia bacterium]